MRWTPEALPPLGPDELLIETRAGATSGGTGLPIYRGDARVATPSPYPRMIGYEGMRIVRSRGGDRTGARRAGRRHLWAPDARETNFFHRTGMDDTQVGESKKDDSAEVAKQGFEALMAGKDHIIAGSLKTKSMENMPKVTPDMMTAQMHRDMAEPESLKQQ